MFTGIHYDTLTGAQIWDDLPANVKKCHLFKCLNQINLYMFRLRWGKLYSRKVEETIFNSGTPKNILAHMEVDIA